jgi:hypothetical protein
MSAAPQLRANPREIPLAWLAACGVLVLIGLASFVVGLRTDPRATWLAYHSNFVYFATLSQAGVVVSAALVIVGARWSGPIRFVAEALSAWVPVSLVVGIVGMWFGREVIYANWLHGAPPGKEAWLSFGRVFASDVAVMGAMTLLTLAYLRASFRPTLHGAAARATRAKGMFESWTRDWKGDQAEADASLARLRTLAPILCLAYAFGYTLVGYDQVMSLSPTWYSTMFGWYFCWGGWLSAVAATALSCTLLRRSSGWKGEITRPRLHDLGKMVFAFSIFWMYIFFAQYIVIWYGNLPEETQFIQARLGSQFLQDSWYFALSRLDEPYAKLSLTAWACNWVVPFWVLLGQRPKRTPAILGGVAALIVVGFWLERNALIWPSLIPQDGHAWLGGIQLGIAAGFFGAFALVYLVFTRVFPTLPLPASDRS